MKFTTAIAGTAALFASLASASPIEARSTGADFTNFKVSCDASSCTYVHILLFPNSPHPKHSLLTPHSYSTSINLTPENYAVTCTHKTSGPTIPSPGSKWTCTDSNVWLRFNKSLIKPFDYRIVLNDARDAKDNKNYQRISPASEWPEDKKYTGPSSFSIKATGTGGGVVIIG